MALIAAPLQVYSDFSGYTDMALGFALLFGLEIKNNFNFPFRAKTVTDFWRRWHITLLDWFNEYIFSPVSLSLRGLGKPAVAIAILVTFLVSGFWHGAAWTFIVWGLLHGLMLILEYFTAAWREEGIKKKQHQGRRSFWAVVTFLFIAASFVLFKCNSLDNAWTVIEKIFSGFDEDIISDWVSVYYGVLIVMVAGYVMHYLPERISTKLQMKFRQLHWAIQAIIVACVIYFVYQVIATDTKPFIYLEF
jgi:D-alanyl-lipoteichoic acid acyltransferase DltB (MBOAT superfamily)